MALVTLHPVFTVKDEDATAALLAICIEKTKTEEGCVYYEFFRSGDKLIVREGYVDGAAVLKHLENVGEELGKAMEGPVTLDRIEVLGPQAELDVVKEAMDPLGTKYYAISMGFDKMDSKK